MSQSPQPNPAPRAHALDALRGLAILAMVLSGIVPHGLPAWMYHAQVGPPTYEFDPGHPGLTWVDLVFPFFLFSMGAAIPLALTRRIEKGTPMRSIVQGIAWRGVLLAAFAYFREHSLSLVFRADAVVGRPEWAMALAAFPLVWAIWGRLPQTWSRGAVSGVRAFGWIGAAILLTHVPYAGQHFVYTWPAFRTWLGNMDIIILVLANVSVAGSLIWLCTRNHWFARLAPAGLFLALKISSASPGWTKALWAATPADWLYRMEFLKYLMIVLPGTLIGDLLVQWMRAPVDPAGTPRWSRARCVGLAAAASACVPAMLITLQARRPALGTLVACLLCAAANWFGRQPRTELERLLARLVQWGTYWLLMGLCFEPFEGGIKKDHTTISYFFVSMGLAHLTLAAFTVVTDVLHARRSVKLLVENGQNPLLAYCTLTNFVQPVLGLVGIAAVLDRVDAWFGSPWAGAVHAGFVTLLSALVVAFCTRRGWFVRA